MGSVVVDAVASIFTAGSVVAVFTDIDVTSPVLTPLVASFKSFALSTSSAYIKYCVFFP